MNNFFFLLCVITLSYTCSIAQDSLSKSDTIVKMVPRQAKSWRGIQLDFGINQYSTPSNSILPSLKKWGCRSVNVYYYWGIRLAKKLAIAPGIGMGFDNYSFKNEDIRLSTNSGDSLAIGLPIQAPGSFESKKSKLALTWLDVPFEIRFQTGRYRRSAFRLAVGCKGGYLINAHSKVKYTSLDGRDQTIKEKLHDGFGLNTWRFGLTARIGFNRLNLFGYYSLTSLFDKGPEAQSWMVGISISDLMRPGKMKGVKKITKQPDIAVNAKLNKSKGEKIH